MAEARPRIFLVGGHESADGADLVRLEGAVAGARTARPGRQFHNALSEALDAGELVVVVPMTFGRNPTMVSDTAKTLRWLGSKHAGRLALAAPFGTIDHLTAWLRTAVNAAHAEDPDAGLVVVGQRSNPFDEAELHRVAYLVATHGAVREVFPAIVGEGAGIREIIDRLRRLGIERTVVVPAGFAAEAPGELAAIEGARFAGPLMSDAAIARVVRTRTAAALDDLAAGHDGIAAGIDADHGHGYAHSHAFEEDAGGHTHGTHTHTHGGHAHTHTHGGHAHTHTHDGPHAHVHTS